LEEKGWTAKNIGASVSDSRRSRDGFTDGLMPEETIYKVVIPLIQSVIQMASILAMDNIQPSTVMHGTKDILQLGTSYINPNHNNLPRM
jgi:hypothetical protein